MWLAGLALLVACGVLGGAAWMQRPTRQFHDALAALERSDFEAAEDAIESLKRAPGFESHVCFLRAESLFRGGQYASALYELAGVRPEGELWQPTLLLKGRCLYALGRLADAERVFRSVAQESDSPQAHRALATIYHDLGSMDAVLSELKEVVRLQPDDFFAYRLMGQVYKQDRDQQAKAIEFYREALLRKPPPDQRRIIARELAESLTAQFRHSEALQVLEQAETNAFTLALRAECHLSLGDRSRARALLARAQNLDPQERAVLFLAARMDCEDGNPAPAVPRLKTLLEADAHDFAARYQLALAYRQLGDTDAARFELEAVQRSQEKHRRLKDLYRDAMSSPNDSGIRDEIAELCTELGQQRLAAIWRRAAAECRKAQGPAL